MIIFQNGGTLSNSRCKRYADRVQAHVLDEVESAVARAMRGAVVSQRPSSKHPHALTGRY